MRFSPSGRHPGNEFSGPAEFTVGNYYRESHSRMFVSRISFPSVVGQRRPTSWPLDSSAFLFIRFPVIVRIPLRIRRDSSFVPETPSFAEERMLPTRFNGRNYVSPKNLLSFFFFFGNFKKRSIIRDPFFLSSTLLFFSFLFYRISDSFLRSNRNERNV